MSELSGIINWLAKKIERTYAAEEPSILQKEIDWVNNLTGLSISASGKTSEDYVDALYNPVIFHLDDMAEAGKTEECQRLIDLIDAHLDEFGG